MTDFTMFAGNTHEVRITATDEESDDPVDLTTVTEILFLASKKVGDATPTIVKTKTDGEIVVTDAAAGKFTVTLLPADTVTQKGTLHFDAHLIFPPGTTGVSTVQSGTITLDPTLLRAGDID